jgi:hypothetical protein
MEYDSRRIEAEGQTFVFRVEAPGTYALKFDKRDLVRNINLNDFVQVIATEAAESTGTGWFGPAVDRGRVQAEPRWPNSLAEAQAARQASRSPPAAAVPPPPGGTEPPPVQAPPPAAGSTPPAAGSTPNETAAPAPRQPASPASAVETAPDLPPPFPPERPPAFPTETPPETVLRQSRDEFNAGRTAEAIALLDRLRGQNPQGSDETWWLYGQYYEAAGASRNILAALEYYRRLIREYPLSSFYNDARKRIAYLERYYINIQ